MFTPTSLLVRPIFGRLREIPADKIYMLRRITVTTGPYNVPMNVPGLELTLQYGEKLILTLDMEMADEIPERLAQLAHISVE
jgi:hypothetical protein